MAFRHVELLPGVVQIQGPLGFCSTLVIGEREALLVDTMCGVGDLAGYVGGLTANRVTVINTHGHFDHVGGNWQFSRAYLHALDYQAARWLREDERRRELVERLEGNGGLDLDGQDRHNLLNGGFDRYEPLTEGMTFDLVGLTAVAVALPGHTAGSMGLLLPERRVLLSGDAMTPIMCLFFPESLGREDYLNTLDRALELPFDHFITGHHLRLFPKEALEGFRACAEAVPAIRGLKFQHDIFPEYTGRLYIYRGENSGDEDFLALIGPDLHQKRRPKEGKTG